MAACNLQLSTLLWAPPHPFRPVPHSLHKAARSRVRMPALLKARIHPASRVGATLSAFSPRLLHNQLHLHEGPRTMKRDCLYETPNKLNSLLLKKLWYDLDEPRASIFARVLNHSFTLYTCLFLRVLS